MRIGLKSYQQRFEAYLMYETVAVLGNGAIILVAVDATTVVASMNVSLSSPISGSWKEYVAKPYLDKLLRQLYS